MFLLYLDDSGAVTNPADKYVILAGVSVHERVPFWLSRQLDNLAKEVWPDKPENLEFRGSDIFNGRKHWRGIGKSKRIECYKKALDILAKSSRVSIFAAVVNKAAISPADPTEYAFEELASRFDKMLLREHRRKNTHRGLIVLDKSSYETSLQGLATEFRNTGHKWGRLTNMSEVPLFVDSKATRMIQYADLVAYAMRRYYERGEKDYFDILADRLDSEGGVIHGLVHHTLPGSGCPCLVCLQKKGY